MSQQPASQPPASEPPKKTSTGIQENIEGLLCYFWIAAIIFLLIEKESKVVKFHAVQGLCLSILLLLGVIPLLGWIIWIATVIIIIYMMVKTYQGNLVKLPIIGAFAAKQAGV